MPQPYFSSHQQPAKTTSARQTQRHRPHVGTRQDRFIPVRIETLVKALTKAFAATSTQTSVQTSAPTPTETADCDFFTNDLNTDGIKKTSSIWATHQAVTRYIAVCTLPKRLAIDEAYAPLNPDRDTRKLRHETVPTEKDRQLFRTQLIDLLNQANYERIDDVRIASAIEAASSHGLKVHIRAELVESLEVFVRGRTRIRRRRRIFSLRELASRGFRPITLRCMLAGRRESLPVYRRLVVAVRLKDEPDVVLRKFRDIPEQDILALLPHAEVRMSWLDRMKVIGGSAGALGGVVSTGWKILLGGAVVLTHLAWVIGIAVISLCLKAFLGYRRTQKARRSQHTQSLYDQQMASNAAVIHGLNHQIIHEEIKELFLGFIFIYADNILPRTEPINTANKLGDQITTWLQQVFGICCNFDAQDAVNKLIQCGLIQYQADTSSNTSSNTSKTFTPSHRCLHDAIKHLNTHITDHMGDPIRLESNDAIKHDDSAELRAD